MSEPREEKTARGSGKSKKAVFRPNFTLSIVYLFLFFFIYSMLFMLPALRDFSNTLPLSMPLEEANAEIAAYAKGLIGPRLIWMLGAALTTTALGIYSGVLPGVRPKR
jgi:hypothetical protein